MKSFLPEMIRRSRGHLVTISSSAAIVAVNRLSDYCASKSASSTLLDAVHYELMNGGHDGVYTTLVCPYYTDTGMFAGCVSR
jgi:all-trans-retinol dehydrogenase (NAD+)